MGCSSAYGIFFFKYLSIWWTWKAMKEGKRTFNGKSRGRLPRGLAEGGVKWGGQQLLAAPDPSRQTHITPHSLQILPPGGMQRLDPQRETDTPASGHSTDPTLPSQHTPSPQTGDCPHPGLQDPWTRRVTATVSAHHKTQVGPVCFFLDHSRISQAPRGGEPGKPLCPPVELVLWRSLSNDTHSSVHSQASCAAFPICKALLSSARWNWNASLLQVSWISHPCFSLLLVSTPTERKRHFYILTHTMAVIADCALRASDPLPPPGLRAWTWHSFHDKVTAPPTGNMGWSFWQLTSLIIR